MSVKFKKEFLDLLEKDLEFRYAVAGYLGLSEILKRMDRLEENQNRLWEEIRALREEQNKLWENQNKLLEEVKNLREGQNKLVESINRLSMEVNKFSETIGFGLEDIAKVVVPGWLYRHENIIVENLERRFFFIDEYEVEVNLYGEGLKGDEKIVIIGEVKSRIYERDVKRFNESIEKMMKVIKYKIYPIMFAFYIHPSAEEEAKNKGIRLIASYMR